MKNSSYLQNSYMRKETKEDRYVWNHSLNEENAKHFDTEHTTDYSNVKWKHSK